MFDLIKLAEQRKDIYTEIMPWQIAVSELEYDTLNAATSEVKLAGKVIAKWDSQLNEGWILEGFKSKIAAAALGATAALSGHAGLNVATQNALNVSANGQSITATSNVQRLKINGVVYSKTSDSAPAYANEFKEAGRVFKYWEDDGVLRMKKFTEVTTK